MPLKSTLYIKRQLEGRIFQFYFIAFLFVFKFALVIRQWSFSQNSGNLSATAHLSLALAENDSHENLMAQQVKVLTEPNVKSKEKFLTEKNISQSINFLNFSKRNFKIPLSEGSINGEINILKQFTTLTMASYCLSETQAIGPGIYAGFIFYQKKKVVIGIRGEPLGNEEYWGVRQNILVPYPGIAGAKIDYEFRSRFESIKPKFKEFYDTQLKNGDVEDVIGVGHGSGGVYVLLGMLELIALNVKQKLSVFTLGQPRIGNRQFAHYLNSLANTKIRISRLINMDDYVPRLPLSPFESFYTHTLLETWIEADDCLCATEKVFACAGPRSGLDNFVEESLQCNNQYSTKSYAAHIGPYFGMMMQRPPGQFPWLTI
ncbi:hypothetical protein G9A89_010259 [Geosiphon pyriformis]|nr:hypothetical protein G9A89_010259 [Geosiphon pyriformis]